MFLQVYKYFFCSKTNRRSLLWVEFGICIGRESSNVLLFIQDISTLLIVSNTQLIHNNQLPLTKFGTKHVGSLVKPKIKPAIWQDNAMANVQIVQEHSSMSTKLFSNI